MRLLRELKEGFFQHTLREKRATALPPLLTNTANHLRSNLCRSLLPSDLHIIPAPNRSLCFLVNIPTSSSFHTLRGSMPPPEAPSTNESFQRSSHTPRPTERAANDVLLDVLDHTRYPDPRLDLLDSHMFSITYSNTFSRTSISATLNTPCIKDTIENERR